MAEQSEQVTATIKDGRIVTLWGVRRLFGTIHGDTLGRYPDGHEIGTSRVKKGKRGDELVRTRNSLYRVEWADDDKAE